MTEPVVGGILSLLAGFALGLGYFGGLWLTVRRLPQTARPLVWYLGSYGVRTALLLAAFYLILEGGWDKLLLSLLGFMAARFLLVRRINERSSSLADRRMGS